MGGMLTVNVTPEQRAAIEALGALVAAGGLHDRQEVQSIGPSLSHTGRRHRNYMLPAAARQLGERGRQFVQGKDAVQEFSNPTTGDVHVDAVLTEISVGYTNAAYIGTRLFPRVQVTKDSDVYFIYEKSDWFRNEARVRAPGTRAAHGGYRLSTDSYKVEPYSFEQPVPDELRKAADAPIEPDRDATRLATDMIDLKVEKLVEDVAFTYTNWTSYTTLSGTSQWSHSSATPLTAFSTARLAVAKLIGRLPNTFCCGIEVFEKLALHSTLLDLIKYGGTGDRPAMVTAGMLAQLLQVDQVLVGSSIEDAGYEGGTDDFDFVWGKLAWLGYVAPQPSRAQPSAGYVFTKGRQADSYREDSIKTDWVRAEEAIDVKAVCADAGYLWIDAVA